MTENDTSNVLAEIKITIKGDQVVWDIGQLTVPDFVFWLRTVEHMVLAQVVGDTNVARTD